MDGLLAFAGPTINASQLGLPSAATAAAGRGAPAAGQPNGSGVAYVDPGLGRAPAAVWVGLILLLVALRVAYEIAD